MFGLIKDKEKLISILEKENKALAEAVTLNENQKLNLEQRMRSDAISFFATRSKDLDTHKLIREADKLVQFILGGMIPQELASLHTLRKPNEEQTR